MFDTEHTRQPGQSFTLDVRREEASGKTCVSCPSVPDVGIVEDTDQRFAIQEMRRRLDDHTMRGFQTSRSPLIIGSNQDPV
jgi:hypothetical protein